jgi:hypothetical protein
MLQNLMQRSDQVNTRLGEVAQKQNRCMVRYRRIQEKVDAGQLDLRIASEEKRQETIAELRAERDAYDHEVARHMEADASIDKQITLAEKTITESAATIKELTARLKAASEAKKVNHGVPWSKLEVMFFREPGSPARTARCLFKKTSKSRPSLQQTDRTDQDQNDGVLRLIPSDSTKQDENRGCLKDQQPTTAFRG